MELPSKWIDAMSLHETAIIARLKRFLDRRTMPKFLDAKPQAISDELGAMTRTIARFAPRGDMSEWWDKFESDIGRRNSTRSWPSDGEIEASCKAVSAPIRNSIAEPGTVDEYAIASRRIQNGESIGDEWLYGRKAVELVQRGLATDGALRPYRSALYFRAKDMWGPERAAEYERELQDRHEEAALSMRSMSERQNVNAFIPDKRHSPDVFE